MVQKVSGKVQEAPRSLLDPPKYIFGFRKRKNVILKHMFELPIVLPIALPIELPIGIAYCATPYYST